MKAKFINEAFEKKSAESRRDNITNPHLAEITDARKLVRAIHDDLYVPQWKIDEITNDQKQFFIFLNWLPKTTSPKEQNIWKKYIKDAEKRLVGIAAQITTFDQLQNFMDNVPDWKDYKINPDLLAEKHTWNLTYGYAESSDGYIEDYLKAYSIKDIVNNITEISLKVLSDIEEDLINDGGRWNEKKRGEGYELDFMQVNEITISEEEDSPTFSLLEFIPKEMVTHKYNYDSWEHMWEILYIILKKENPRKIRYQVEDIQRKAEFFKKMGET